MPVAMEIAWRKPSHSHFQSHIRFLSYMCMPPLRFFRIKWQLRHVIKPLAMLRKVDSDLYWSFPL